MNGDEDWNNTMECARGAGGWDGGTGGMEWWSGGVVEFPAVGPQARRYNLGDPTNRRTYFGGKVLQKVVSAAGVTCRPPNGGGSPRRSAGSGLGGSIRS